MGRKNDRSVPAIAIGWDSARGRRRRPSRQRIIASLMLVPLVMGLLGAPSSTPIVRGDELTDAKDKQAQLTKEVAKQKEQVKELNALQRGLATEISNTRKQLAGINADLNAVRKKITKMGAAIDEVKGKYNDLVAQLAAMDEQLVVITAQEVVKKQELRERQALLAERIRSAYDTDRTSLLESFLSGGTFTDLLTEMSYVHRRRRAGQGPRPADRPRPGGPRGPAPERRRHARPDQRPAPARRPTRSARSTPASRPSRRPRPSCASSRRRPSGTSRSSGRPSPRSRANKANAAKALKVAAKAQRQLAAKISEIVRQPVPGRATSRPSTTARSMADVGQRDPELRVHRVLVGAAAGRLRRTSTRASTSWRRTGTKVRASGDGVVAYIGWNYADGADPAWIVIIAHSSNLQTWYAHMTAGVSGRDQGRQQGQVRPGHRLRGQHRPLDRRPPALGGQVQRQLRQPAPVPVGRHLGRPTRSACHETFTPRRLRRSRA